MNPTAERPRSAIGRKQGYASAFYGQNAGANSALADFDVHRIHAFGAATIFVAGFDECSEERMGLEGLGLELGMELAAQKEGVAGNLDDFDVGGVGGGAGDVQAGAGEQGFVLAVEFVTVTVTF